MKKLLKPPKTHPPNQRLAKHLRKHRGQLFAFLRHPGIDATNYRAEQAIRPAVVNRKVWGGNRTEAGGGSVDPDVGVVHGRELNRDVLEFVGRCSALIASNRPMLLSSSG